MKTRVEIDEGERQMLLLSLALCALLRPGFDWLLGEMADQFHGREMFEGFKKANDDQVKPQWGEYHPHPGGEGIKSDPDVTDKAAACPPGSGGAA